MIESFKRPYFLLVAVSNLYSIFGLLFWHWRVADIFFWFWCELVLIGIILVVLTAVWSRVDFSLPLGKLTPFFTAFGVLVILFYTTLFAGVAYMGEWRAWSRFPEFLADKEPGIAAIAVCSAIYFIATLRKPCFGSAEAKNIEKQYGRKAIPVVGIYAVFILVGILNGGRLFDEPKNHLKTMGMLLLLFKVAAEFGALDRFCDRESKQK